MNESVLSIYGLVADSCEHVRTHTVNLLTIRYPLEILFQEGQDC
jgi:hypothetical protein